MRGIVARTTKLGLASAVAGALLVPASLMAAGDPPARSAAAGTAVVVDDAAPPPHAALAVTVAGDTARLDASRSTGAVSYRWDLDGNGTFETSAGRRLTRSFAPGDHHVAVRVADARGRSDDAAGDVNVAPKQPAPQPKPKRVAVGKPRVRARVRKHAAVQAAAAGSVTMQNFAFHPGSITINTGDTVTWTNNDSAPHTATGKGGSFDTGTIKKGQSASHTFQSPGTFSYTCTIHPNMHGTVVVKGASSGGSSSTPSGSTGSGTSAGSTSTSSSPTATGSAASGSGSLPHTGLQLLAVVLLGAFMTASGATLRLVLGAAPRRARHRG